MLSYSKKVLIKVIVTPHRDHIALHIELFVSIKDITAVAKEVLNVVTSRTVSYTHLTLPTIE